ncbi:MAG TPA: carboxypeptidase-like regulatory domain-containing protein, partial [Pseudomonadota bacterium]|nr:carboxypeptidase-like regulatory domain-containing protein [Pseudomonadota bacterium]
MVSRDRAAAIVLGCALLGVLAGGAVRTWRGAQVARGGAAQSSPVTAAAGPVLTAPQAVGSSISAVMGGVDQGTVKDLGAATAATGDGGTQARAAARAVWVQVLDAQGQAAAGAQVVLRLAFTPSELSGSAPNLLARPPQKDPNAKIGELGVLPGPLPFPEDVVAGTARPAAGLGGAQRGLGEVLLLSGTTDKQGLLRLGPAPSGQVQVMAAAQGLTAQADLVIPPGYQGSEDAGSALRVLLRLAVPTALTGQVLSELSVTTDPDALPLQGTLEEGPEVHGRVVDGRGFAVASARVELLVGRSRTVALTDAAGVFAARGLPRGPLVATVKQQGFAPLQLSQSSEQPRDNLKLVLQPGGGIEGQVRDARLGGVPSGAVLTVETSGSGAQSVTLGSGGHFVVTGLVPGTAVLRARAPGFALLL